MTSKNLSIKEQQDATASAKEESKTWLTPAVDIYETEEHLTLIADLPGVGREGVEIGLEKNILTIEGQVSAASGYLRQFQLPESLDSDRVSAELKDGTLTVILPKVAAARPRRIAVTVH